MFKPKVPGGNFKSSAIDKGVNEAHMQDMGRVAAARVKASKSLSAGKTVSPLQGRRVVSSGAPPQTPDNPGMPKGGLVAGATAPPHMRTSPAGGDYRAAISMAAAHHGVSAGPREIHQSIGRLVHQGTFTPEQGELLRAHQGPLTGPGGVNTLRNIARDVVGYHMGGAPF